MSFDKINLISEIVVGLIGIYLFLYSTIRFFKLNKTNKMSRYIAIALFWFLSLIFLIYCIFDSITTGNFNKLTNIAGIIFALGNFVIMFLLMAMSFDAEEKRDFEFVRSTLKPYKTQLVEYFTNNNFEENKTYLEFEIVDIIRKYFLELSVDIDIPTKNKLIKKLNLMYEYAKLSQSTNTIGFIL